MENTSLYDFMTSIINDSIGVWHNSDHPRYFYLYVPKTGLEAKIYTQNPYCFNINFIDEKESKNKSKNNEVVKFSISLDSSDSQKIIQDIYKKHNKTISRTEEQPKRVAEILNLLKNDVGINSPDSKFKTDPTTSTGLIIIKMKESDDSILIQIPLGVNFIYDPFKLTFIYDENGKRQSFEHIVSAQDIQKYQGLYNSNTYKNLNIIHTLSNTTQLLEELSTLTDLDEKSYLSNRILKTIVSNGNKPENKKHKL